MGHKSLVSVVTPVYNGEDFLAECIESVLAQVYQNFEYIIVDNCSSDRSLEIAMGYSRSDERIRVHRNDKFVGVMENHNLALRLVSQAAKYCKVVCADDFIFPNCILRMVELAEANPTVGLIGGYQLSADRVKWQGFRYPQTVLSGVEMCRQVLLGGDEAFGFGSPTSTLYRADLVRKNYDFYPNASPHADTSACFQCLCDSDYGFVYEVLSYERIHSESQSHISVELNRYASAYLNDVIDYGPHFLGKDEFRNKLTETLKGYHRFLAVSYLSGVRNKKFWDYHEMRLEELGHPLKRSDLLKAAAIAVAEKSLNPGQAVANLRKRVFSGQMEGDRRTQVPGVAVKGH
jgi:glycosyltransferase involved in cell wall biosynthesis